MSEMVTINWSNASEVAKLCAIDPVTTRASESLPLPRRRAGFPNRPWSPLHRRFFLARARPCLLALGRRLCRL